MVYVPGGSRGCSSCKVRKIKVSSNLPDKRSHDENFPQCLKCRKSGRNCDGPVLGPVIRPRN
ncbi:hypothetical protein V1512DRAFT_205908 [Lipomyces arxii]|uniref:uncharacterized protein n=1 Tax=Lipomyces arxii TaxID=56418 RepID=UPI0034CE27D8